MTNRYKIIISINIRFLLHLLDYLEFKRVYEVDNAITQEGIAEIIGIRNEHVSRTVKELIAERFVFCRTAHIKGKNRRKKAYFLTRKGIVFINGFIESFNDNKILVRTLKNELKEIKFHQLTEYLGFYVSPLIAYNYSRKSKKNENVINLKQIIEDKKNITQQRKTIEKFSDLPAVSHPKQSFIYSNEIPIIEDFSGRENELKTIKNALNKDTKIIIIYGKDGIGKTSLVSKVVNDLKRNTNLFWYRFEPWDSLNHFLTSFAMFLTQTGKEKLYSYFKLNTDFYIEDIIDILDFELNGINAVFVFDDLHNASKHTKKLISKLTNIYQNIKSPKTILISHSKPRLYTGKNNSIKNLIIEIPISEKFQ